MVMAKTATEVEEEYRRQTAAYVAAVQEARGWTISALARQAELDRSTVSRAANGKKKTEFHRLLKIEKASRVQIPQALHEAYAALSDIPGGEMGRIYNEALDMMRKLQRSDPDGFQRALKEATKEGA